MQTIARHGISLALLCALAQGAFAQAQPASVKDDSQMKTSVMIEADNPAIRYTGHVDFTNPKAPSFAWPAVQIEARFEGPDIDVILADSGNKDYFAASVDGGTPVVLQSARGSRTLQIARALPAGIHTVNVWKRTEALCGTATFKGFVLPSGGTVLPFDAKGERRMEFIGDSITCGYGNLISVNDPEHYQFTPQNEDSSIAWGALTAKALGARYQAIAYSGRGLFRNCDGTETGILPEIYPTVYPDNARKAKWDPSRYRPDVVVINLGTNDYNSQMTLKDLEPAAFDARFAASYKALIKTIRANYGAATKIVLVVGSMMGDSFPEGTNSWTRIQACVSGAVKDLNAAGDAAVYYLALAPQSAPFGEDWHPTAATHEIMAKTATGFIRSITGWK